MKNFAKLVSAVALTALLMNSFATTAGAQTQNATQQNTTTITCTAGNYGTNECNNYTNQNINQNMSVNNRDKLYHKTTGAGLNQTSMVATVVTLVTTAGASFVSLKTKLS